MRNSFILVIAALALAACKSEGQLPSVISPYRIDIQQGNVVTQEMVAKLKAGMTRSQVRFVLGSPLVTDMFHGDRWDYVYLMQKQGKADERRRLTVIFDGDKLATIEGDVVLSDRELEPAVRHPETKPAVTPKPATVKPQAQPATKEVAKPATSPAPKQEVAKPAPTPAPKTDAPASALPTFQKPAPAPKPEVATPAPKGDTPATAMPTFQKPAPAPAPVAKPEAAPDQVKPAADAPAAQPEAEVPQSQAAKPDAPKADAAKASDAKTDAAKADANKKDAKASDDKKGDEKKDTADKGTFRRMLDKIGF